MRRRERARSCAGTADDAIAGHERSTSNSSDRVVPSFRLGVTNCKAKETPSTLSPPPSSHPTSAEPPAKSEPTDDVCVRRAPSQVSEPGQARDPRDLNPTLNCRLSARGWRERRAHLRRSEHLDHRNMIGTTTSLASPSQAAAGTWNVTVGARRRRRLGRSIPAITRLGSTI